MNRGAIVALATGALFVALAVLAPPDPWSPGAFAMGIGAALVALLALLALRAPDAPAGLTLRAAARVAAASLGIVTLHVLLPQWGLAASFLADPFRREMIATTALVASSLVVLTVATQETQR